MSIKLVLKRYCRYNLKFGDLVGGDISTGLPVSGGNGCFISLNYIPTLNDTFYLSVGYPGKKDGTMDGEVMIGRIGKNASSGSSGSLVSKYVSEQYNLLAVASGGYINPSMLISANGGNGGGLIGQNGGFFGELKNEAIGGNNADGGNGLIVMCIEKEVLVMEELKIDNLVLSSILINNLSLSKRFNIEHNDTLDTTIFLLCIK